MKTIFRVFLTVCMLIIAPHVLPLNAYISSSNGYEQSYEAISKIVHQKGSSVELDIPLNIAQNIAVNIMNECDEIEFIHNPRLSPDQSMVFIGYFLKGKLGELRIIHLHQATLGAKILVKNDTIENFSKYTYKHYKTKFFYVDPMDDHSQNEEKPWN